MARAQFSLYSSVSYTFHQNPLYSYEKFPDQLKQTYLETGYAKQYANSTFKLQYVSGLTLFTKFQDRNFYEHSLLAGYKILFGQAAAKPISEGDSAEADERDETVQDSTEAVDQNDTAAVAEDPTQSEVLNAAEVGTGDESDDSAEDSTRGYGDFAMKLGVRHDKAAFDEFDNDGLEFLANYRSAMSGQLFYRLTNNFTLRSYLNISALSNFSDIAAFETSHGTSSQLRYGAAVSGGVKYYTQSAYDTSRFEQQRTFIIKSPGKGKPGANLLVPSDKKILVTSQSNGTIQLAGELYVEKKWGETVLGASVTYRWNPRSSPRYLAQTTSASMLKEDVYNDCFSYEGPELHAQVSGRIFAGIAVKLGVSFSRKTFGAPALDLVGSEITSHREDSHASADLFLSRDFTLWGEVTAGVFIGAESLRNLSNDQYNDFSASVISAGVGIGF